MWKKGDDRNLQDMLQNCSIFQVIVTVKNVQGPNLEASETVTFVYTNENVYFPDDIEFQK